jgi:hypothetical protein
MKTLGSLALSLAFLTPAIGADDVQPGRGGDYQFAGSENVEGTEWKGALGQHGPFVVRFERGGVVCYSLVGSTLRDMNWRQEGGTVYMAANNKYSEFRLTVRGDRLVGEGRNQGGEVWKLDMKRVGPAPKAEGVELVPPGGRGAIGR